MAAPMDAGDDVDIFADIVNTESRFQNEGFTNGFKAGKESGFMDGFSTGLNQGRMIGSEIGFYSGFTSHLLKSSKSGKEDDEDKKYHRKLKVLSGLQKMLEDFEIEKPHHENYSRDLERIRIKFKQVCSLFKADSSVQEDLGLQF